MLTQQLKEIILCDESAGAFKDIRRDMLMFWKTMREIYGHGWTGQYGESPTYGWVLAIGSLPADKIRSGLKRLISIGIDEAHTRGRFTSVPPTPYEFRALCESSNYGLDHIPMSLSVH